MTNDGRICIFAKAPVAGRVKTRLAATLGTERAAALARAFLLDTCAATRALPWAKAILAIDGELDDTTAGLIGIPSWPQGDGDLGARLERILSYALAEADFAIAIGTDAPGLPAKLLTAARDALETADAAIGPSLDGGFYLLALRHCPPGLLAALPWSRTDTLACTVARLLEHGLAVSVLEPWFDVDHAADLAHLQLHLDAGTVRAPETARIVRALTATSGHAWEPELPLAYLDPKTIAPARVGDSGKLTGDVHPAHISVVMPVLDEERRIDRALSEVLAIPGLHEVIVVDGGSRDQTAALVQARCVRSRDRDSIPLRAIAGPRGRARQMNAGARVATGDTLLFLHADTTLPRDAVDHVRAVLADPAVVAGAFKTWTVADEPRPWFAGALHAADLRSRYTRLPYGDQALFVRAEAFAAIGGFPDQPLMEDLALARRLSRCGQIRTARATVRVSGRRFVARPLYYAVVMNVLPVLYRFGVSPARLARFYAAVR